MTFTIQRADGNTRRFDEWGIKSARLTQANCVAGSLELGFGASDLLGALPFEPAETLLILVDDEPFFRGRINGEIRGAYGSNEGLLLPLADPWWYLEQLIYQVEKVVVTSSTQNPTNPAGLTVRDFTTTTKIISEVIISQDQLRVTVDSRAQILDVLAFAIAQGAPIAIGTIDPGIAMPRDLVTDITCAEMIRKSMRWTPDQAAFWDYSVDPPELNIRSRANRALLTLDIADLEIGQVEINPRRDLLRAGVRINYLRRHQRNNFEFLTVDQDDAGPTPAGIGALVVTLELYGSYLSNNILVPEEETPEGLALRLYNAYSVLPFQGRALQVNDEIDPSILYLGRTLRIVGGAPDWSTATMDIQQVTQDLFFGRTEISVGPPSQLGPTDLVGLVRKGRTVPPRYFHVDPNVPHPNPDHPPPDNPDPRFEFQPPHRPDVVLGRSIHYICPFTSGGHFDAEDFVDIYSAVGGAFVARVTYSNLIDSGIPEGGIGSLHDIIFGRAHQTTGACTVDGTDIVSIDKGPVYQSNYHH